MNLKFIYLPSAIALALAAIPTHAAQNDGIIMLDLSKSSTPLSFDASNGMWTGTYDDDETEIESQVFSITHGSMEEYRTWWGFTASNSTDNSYQSNTLTYQFSNMAAGGILLNDDGTVKTNEFGAPLTGKEMPYLVAFLMSPAEITFNTDKSYEMVGAYFNLNSYTFYSVLLGDSYARAFTQGDDLKLIVHGIDAEDNEKTVEISLASFNNGNLTANTGWQYVDLSSLGVVEELKFTMTGTDSGKWGLNTPAYFCMDKLAVREASQSTRVSEIATGSKNEISYDRNAKTLNLGNADFAIIYDTLGHIVKSVSDSHQCSVQDLPAGVYIVKAGNARLKFSR